jgi:hypothetical protein
MDVIQGLDGFLAQEIENAEEKLRIQLSPYSKLYLLHLMKRLSEDEDFFCSEVLKERPLGVLLLEAVHKDIFGKIRNLKIVGDLSLVFSGLFPEFLTRRMVDIDYFMSLGRKSYSLLSDTYSQYRTKRELFILYSQLVAEFFYLTEIMTEISDDMNFLDRSNIENINARWRKTGVAKYLEILSQNEIVPI